MPPWASFSLPVSDVFGIGSDLFDIALNTQAVAVEKHCGRSILACPPLVGHLPHAFSLQTALSPIAEVLLMVALLTTPLGRVLTWQTEQSE